MAPGPARQTSVEPVRWRLPPPGQRLQLPNLRLFDPALRPEPLPVRQGNGQACSNHVMIQPGSRRAWRRVLARDPSLDLARGRERQATFSAGGRR